MNTRMRFMCITLAVMVSIGCNFFTGILAPSMGEIKIVNSYVEGSEIFPGCRNLPNERNYGVCFIDYAPDNLEDLSKPPSDMLIAAPGDITSFELPPGSYKLQEWRMDAEMNQEPGYNPCFKMFLRPPETIEIPSETEILFGNERSMPAAGEFLEGVPINTNCKFSGITINLPDIPAGVKVETPGQAEEQIKPSDTTKAPVELPDPTQMEYVRGFEGVWETNWGEMTCRVDGVMVHCNYTWDQGRIDALLSADGKTMEGQWAESPSYSPPEDGGRVTFSLSPDGNSIDGYWWYGQDRDGGAWTGVRK